MLYKSVVRWLDDGAFQVSAALAYYAIFSIAPMLVVLLLVVSLVYGGNALLHVRTEAVQYVSPEAADLITQAVGQAGNRLSGGFLYAGVGLLFMLIGVSAFATQLRLALNTMWNIPSSTGGIRHMVRNRIATLLILIVAGAVLLLSLIVTSALSAYQEYLDSFFPHAEFAGQWIDLAVSYAVIAALFAFLYKWFPELDVGWKHAAFGGLLAAALFTAGKSAIAVYLARVGFGSIYGAAGSIMFLLSWLYYSFLILLLGAEFTQVCAESLPLKEDTPSRDH